MSMKTFAAVIFDMDGVLLDSESVCDLVWRKAAKECGIDGIEYLIEKNRVGNAGFLYMVKTYPNPALPSMIEK